tara:strand:+ start:640 stop:945 length:306 start_codon:yes stop_codon:yes gene_type:complete
MEATLIRSRSRSVSNAVNKALKDKLLLAVNEDPGLSSSKYAEICQKRPSDINKLLRGLATDGVVYSTPQTNGTHAWYLNALDHKDRRTKLLCRPWDINVLN